MKRLLLFTGLGVVILLSGVTPALADTPTPVPTPSPTSINTTPGINHNSNFNVDQNAALPWPLPQMPTFPVPSVTPTLYNATPPHATDYAGNVATATAQIAAFSAPANQLQTPVARVSTLAPSVAGGDVDTGLDMDGTGSVTFSDLVTTLGTNFGDFFNHVRGAIESLASMVVTFPFLAPILAAVVIGFAFSMILRLTGMIIKVGIALYNFIKGILTFVGIWKPG